VSVVVPEGGGCEVLLPDEVLCEGSVGGAAVVAGEPEVVEPEVVPVFAGVLVVDVLVWELLVGPEAGAASAVGSVSSSGPIGSLMPMPRSV
jgi:hypothetical protein